MSNKHKRKDGPITGLDGIQKAKLRLDYTREELMQLGDDLAMEINWIKEATQVHLDKMAKYLASARTLADEVRSGHEMVDIDVKAVFDAKTKRKKLYDLKTGEFLREEAMTEADMQIGLPGVIGPAVGKEGA